MDVLKTLKQLIGIVSDEAQSDIETNGTGYRDAVDKALDEAYRRYCVDKTEEDTNES